MQPNNVRESAVAVASEAALWEPSELDESFFLVINNSLSVRLSLFQGGVLFEDRNRVGVAGLFIPEIESERA